MEDLIVKFKNLTQKYREDVILLIPQFKLSIQEECDRLVRDIPNDSVLKTIEAIDLYVDNDKLMFDLLVNADKVVEHLEAGQLEATERLTTYDNRVMNLFRLKVDEDSIPNRFMNIITQLRNSQIVLPILFEEQDRITFWINKG